MIGRLKELFNQDNLAMRSIRFAALAHIVGWVKRDFGTIFVGFAYLNASPQSEVASK
jgi:hypothetical protein